MEVLFSSFRVANRMILHIKTCRMNEQEAKADYVRHNQEVLEHVPPSKVKKQQPHLTLRVAIIW